MDFKENPQWRKIAYNTRLETQNEKHKNKKTEVKAYN